MKRRRGTLLAVLILAFVAVAFLQSQPARPPAQSMVMVAPDAVQWTSPPTLPPGAQMAVLSGDPSKSEPYTIRIKMPNGLRIPAHWHPKPENVVVLKGILFLGTGEKENKAAAHSMVAGTYMTMPAEMRHYGWTKGETILHVYGIGPFVINYVNPADDPTKKK